MLYLFFHSGTDVLNDRREVITFSIIKKNKYTNQQQTKRDNDTTAHAAHNTKTNDDDTTPDFALIDREETAGRIGELYNENKSSLVLHVFVVIVVFRS